MLGHPLTITPRPPYGPLSPCGAIASPCWFSYAALIATTERRPPCRSHANRRLQEAREEKGRPDSKPHKGRIEQRGIQL